MRADFPGIIDEQRAIRIRLHAESMNRVIARAAVSHVSKQVIGEAISCVLAVEIKRAFGTARAMSGQSDRGDRTDNPLAIVCLPRTLLHARIAVDTLGLKGGRIAPSDSREICRRSPRNESTSGSPIHSSRPAVWKSLNSRFRGQILLADLGCTGHPYRKSELSCYLLCYRADVQVEDSGGSDRVVVVQRRAVRVRVSRGSDARGDNQDVLRCVDVIVSASRSADFA